MIPCVAEKMWYCMKYTACSANYKQRFQMVGGAEITANLVQSLTITLYRYLGRASNIVLHSLWQNQGGQQAHQPAGGGWRVDNSGHRVSPSLMVQTSITNTQNDINESSRCDFPRKYVT